MQVAVQVSTGSGTLSRLVELHIAVPEAFILGADEHHVDVGSTINLVCIIEKVLYSIYSLKTSLYIIDLDASSITIKIFNYVQYYRFL